jgi:hypothetical protein
VLEGMGNARRAVLFIHAAGAVPDHMHGGRRAAVFLDDDAQAIGKLSFEGVGKRWRRRCGESQHGNGSKRWFEVGHGWDHGWRARWVEGFW